MKLFTVPIAFLAVVNTVNGQLPRDPRPLKTLTENNTVIIYEDANFGGTGKMFEPGVYLLTGFNDVVSSVQVPPGMGIMIYENGSEKGGDGKYVDLLEDCPDLSVYQFNDIASYISVFKLTNAAGHVWARGKMRDGKFVPGHWERKRADGTLPDNSAPALSSAADNDVAYVPLATQAELDEFNQIRNNQLNVGVLSGGTTRPFYYHHNQPGEEVYKYNKVIDPARLPGQLLTMIEDKLGWAGVVVKPLEVVTDVAGDIKDWIFGSSSTKMKMDCWFPVTEYKKTVCGSMHEDVFICPQNYLHTQVTIDKDVCYSLKPSPSFTSMLTNRWSGETHEEIEGEVKSANMMDYNTATGKSTETLSPRNPFLMQVKKDDNVCFYGPWMGDIMDLNFKVPVPLTDTKIDIGNIDLRKSNEIHPINQFWRKVGSETLLTAVVDGTGYFQKIGNGEVAASGLDQDMRFYVAFTLPAPGIKSLVLTYEINGIGYVFTNYTAQDVNPETISLKQNGIEKLKVTDNSLIRNQKTHTVYFEKIRKRADGSTQGYIVVQTERITRPGGSINIIVKDMTNYGPVNRDRLPVRMRQ
ncbi:MAG: hypothetical protein ABIT05_02660 [Chitinophagaceae bacterium]